ncbi:MAG: DNA-processing protein DprA, partial [Acidimicrobiales bacterium]
MTEPSPAGRPASDDAGILAALAELPAMLPRRLAAVLMGTSPDEAWTDIRAGLFRARPSLRGLLGRDPDGLAERWRVAASAVDPVRVAARYDAAGVKAVRLGGDGYPEVLGDDPEPPAVLFVRGDLSVLARPAVAVVGTRNCTHSGAEIARWLGAEIADRGGVVVSGLALGIDAAAHRGALSRSTGSVAGVVGSGLDVVYPRRHTRLWSDVGSHGVLVSEAPLGAEPAAWRFPARNRMIAALAVVVVVVESHDRGGSLVTARLGFERGRSVLVVPGSIW